MALTRRDVLRLFAESNAHAIDAAGGLDQVSSDGSFDAVNQRYGLAGVRRVRTMRQAIDAVLPTGRPFRIAAIDVETLNETRPAQEAGGFRLPDEVEEQILIEQQDRELAMLAGFAEEPLDDEPEGDDTMSIQTMNNGAAKKVNGVNGTHQTASGAAVSVDPATAMRLEIERLKAENAALVAAKGQSGGPRALSFKVSEKGAVSVYGMGRFPITLYGEQWDRLLEDGQVKALKAFIEANRSRLSKKADK